MPPGGLPGPGRQHEVVPVGVDAAQQVLQQRPPVAQRPLLGKREGAQRMPVWAGGHMRGDQTRILRIPFDSSRYRAGGGAV